jgi:hypothetical protein
MQTIPVFGKTLTNYDCCHLRKLAIKTVSTLHYQNYLNGFEHKKEELNKFSVDWKFKRLDSSESYHIKMMLFMLLKLKLKIEILSLTFLNY